VLSPRARDYPGVEEVLDVVGHESDAPRVLRRGGYATTSIANIIAVSVLARYDRLHSSSAAFYS